MTRYVVLLRGINLGRARRLAMVDLRSLLEGLGGRGVRTYVQSGNAVLDWEGAPGDLGRQVRSALAAQHGLDVPVMVRTGPQLAAVVAAHPWAGEALDPKLLHVAFLSGPPDPVLVAAVDPTALLPERWALGEQAVYLYYAGGVRASRLDRIRLGADLTARNWTTTLALRELSAEQPEVPAGLDSSYPVV